MNPETFYVNVMMSGTKYGYWIFIVCTYNVVVRKIHLIVYGAFFFKVNDRFLVPTALTFRIYVFFEIFTL